MELVLFAVAAVSLSLALVMGVAFMRLSRAERTRAAARVAALSAAADQAPVQASVKRVAATPAVEPVAAAVEPRAAAPWASARISTLTPVSRPAPPAPAKAIAADELPLQAPAFSDGFLGGTSTPTESAGRQRGLAIAAVLLFAVAMGGGYWMMFGGPSTAAQAEVAAEQSPLELVSLRHERRGTALNVTGLVRNPVGGRAVDKLSAVVFLFDQQGGFLSSARASVDYLSLAPGDESPFVISLDAPRNVARYRVSFRTDGGIVPHIDRRGQDPVAANAVNQRTPVR
jgi:hypothetical protein